MRLKTAAPAAALMLALSLMMACKARAEKPLTADELVQAGLEANPQVQAARARWRSAMHAVKQNLAPNDPQVQFTNDDSWTNGITHPAEQVFGVSDSFQFPGKALLQRDSARRNAAIARLAYQATVRDVRARIETAYFQAVLDYALGRVADEMVVDLKRVLEVTQVAYSAGKVTQTDFISAEFDLSAERIERNRLKIAEENDLTLINQLLNRHPGAPLDLDHVIALKPIGVPLDTLVAEANRARQEILEAALNERNSTTALKLAQMEYLPDYTVGYAFDHYIVPGFAPKPNHTETHGLSIGFNIPVFFWLKQNEDVTRAHYDLQAARSDLDSIEIQTRAAVTTIYRSAQYDYRTASAWHETLIPLARQDFQVALVAYASSKIDFVTLSGTLLRSYNARINYLQAANQFLAGKVALEQTIGEPLPK